MDFVLNGKSFFVCKCYDVIDVNCPIQPCLDLIQRSVSVMMPVK